MHGGISVILTGISLMISDAEHILMYLLAIYKSFFVTFPSLLPTFKVCVFLSLSYSCALCILDINVLPNLCVMNIFSHSTGTA